MKRAYYSNSIAGFLNDTEVNVLGEMSLNHSNRTLEDLQKNAWIKQIQILKEQLNGIDGHIYFEFTIPRMGKRVDNIVIVDNTAFIIEFKVGGIKYKKHAIEQVLDYTIDLRNFHEGSHDIQLIPVLVVTNANQETTEKDLVLSFSTAVKANKDNLKDLLKDFVISENKPIDIEAWENSSYKPTPTIIEAAQALYKGHSVEEITRSDSGVINLSRTADCINTIVENSKNTKLKSICFVTGVPGAGKTLAGLNIANERMNADEDEHAVFLSGNGSLVEVLREALIRDEVQTSQENGVRITKKQSAIKANVFIQNIHHFRDEYLKDKNAPVEKVVVFDEAQRAWTKHQTSAFMKRKRGIDDFEMSEPEFLVDVMNRHSDWCTIVCLIGGGQEINTGEAGLEEWIRALKNHFTNWNVYYPNIIVEDNNYLKSREMKRWVNHNGQRDNDLHLAVSVRSFRSEKLSYFIHELLNINIPKANDLLKEFDSDYPIVLTRDLDKAKKWLCNKAKGTERIGLISSSGARRLRPSGVDVKNKISSVNWFLNKSDDIRSSCFLEDVATEFDIQGLEVDWACVAWGANFHINGVDWKYQSFRGTKWQNINQQINKEYLKNTYRVLLTRARQGMVIFIPRGSDSDHTRLDRFYDKTYEYLKDIGILEL